MLQNSIPNTGFVRLSQILSVIPVGKSTWWSGVKAGKYPAPIKLGANTTVWKAEDIHDLIARIAEKHGDIAEAADFIAASHPSHES